MSLRHHFRRPEERETAAVHPEGREEIIIGNVSWTNRREGARGGSTCCFTTFGGGGWHKASVFGCLPLAAPIGLSPPLILTLCGPERVLVVSLLGGGGGGGMREKGITDPSGPPATAQATPPPTHRIGPLRGGGALHTSRSSLSRGSGLCLRGTAIVKRSQSSGCWWWGKGLADVP